MNSIVRLLLICFFALPFFARWVVAGERTDLFDAVCPVRTLSDTRINTVMPSGELQTEDGERFALADVFLPFNPNGRNIRKDVLDQMNETIAGRRVHFLKIDKADRHGAIPAHVVISGNGDKFIWVQQMLIDHGLGIYLPEAYAKKAQNLDCDIEQIRGVLRQIDRQSHAQNVWRQASKRRVYQAKDGALWSKEGRFTLVEGVVVAATTNKFGAFLNFDTDWKTDFTAVFSPQVVQKFENGKNLLSNLIGQRIQLRGILDLYYGPNMRIDHLDQMEIISK